MLSIYHQYEVIFFCLYGKVISILSVYIMITLAFLLFSSKQLYIRDRKRRRWLVGLVH